MSLSARGTDTSVSEVTNIAQHGFWLLVDDREYFVPFTDYPIFRAATVAEIYAVERIGPDQFFWPALDADVELNALAYPESHPLVFRRQDG
jgi:hypothetical protein